MYIPSQFDQTQLPELHGLIQQHPLAAIIVASADGLEANHVPVLLDAARGPFGTLRGHIARANPLWRQVGAGTGVLAVFQGVSHYISPSWYASKREHGKVVPTWNYSAVHARGNIQWFHDLQWLRALLDATTDHHERRYDKPWRVGDAPAEFVGHMLGAIVGFEIPIDSLSGKWKLSQNRTESDRAGIITALTGQADAAAVAMAAAIRRAA